MPLSMEDIWIIALNTELKASHGWEAIPVNNEELPPRAEWED